MLHVALRISLTPSYGALNAALYVAGAGIVLALVLVLFARKKPHGKIALEALDLRQATIRRLGNLSPAGEAWGLVPWRGLVITLGARAVASVARRIIFGRNRRQARAR